MRSFKLALALAVPLALWQTAFAMPQRMSYSQTKKTIDRIDDQGNQFKDNFDHDIHRSGLDSSTRHAMKHTVAAFEESAEHLKKNYHKDNAAVVSVDQVLNQASVIDRFMARHPLTAQLQDEWLLLRQDLDQLAGSYGIATAWPSELARTEWQSPVIVIVPGQLSSTQMANLVNDLQSATDTFDANAAAALASSQYADTEAVNTLYQSIGNFKVAADQLRDNYEAGSVNVDAVNDLLNRAESIDSFIRTHPLSAAAQESWIHVKNDLIRLAAGYNLSPAWLSEK